MIKISADLQAVVDMQGTIAQTLKDGSTLGFAEIMGLTPMTQLRTNIPMALRDHEFNDKLSEIMCIFRTRGREQKRTFRTIPPNIPKAGTDRSPTEFVFTKEGKQDWRDAVVTAIDAYKMLKRRAPVVSGEYKKHIKMGITKGGKNLQALHISPSRLIREIDTLQKGGYAIVLYSDVVNPRNNFPYSQWVEYYHGATNRNWVRGYQRTRQKKGGIFRYIAMRVARRYPNIAVQFTYMQMSSTGGTMPVIFIAPKGTFANRFDQPGKYTAYKASRSKA